MAHDSTFLIPEVAAQPTPQGGNVALYAKSDKQLYYKDDAGTESLLGSDANQVTTNTTQTITGAKTMTGANAFNGTLGATTPAAASVTTLGASGQITSTVTTGTPPMVIASTTQVTNLNASAIGGATFAAPGAIGATTPNSGTFTIVKSTISNGTAEAGVTAVHYGDGVNVTAVLTITNLPLTVGVSENLGVGALIFTLPAGACLIRDAYMSVGLSGVTITNDTPEIGLGTVIASGAVAVLSGTATFEDIITGQVAADTNGTATVKGTAPTANVPLEITTGGAHTIYVNMADGWGANTDADGVLNGTVVISYIRQAA